MSGVGFSDHNRVAGWSAFGPGRVEAAARPARQCRSAAAARKGTRRRSASTSVRRERREKVTDLVQRTLGLGRHRSLKRGPSGQLFRARRASRRGSNTDGRLPRAPGSGATSRACALRRQDNLGNGGAGFREDGRTDTSSSQSRSNFPSGTSALAAATSSARVDRERIWLRLIAHSTQGKLAAGGVEWLEGNG